MYQINKTTGDIKQGAKLAHNYIEVSEEVYNKFKDLSIEQRKLVFSAAEDGDFNNLHANKLNISSGDKSFKSDGEQNSTNGGYIGQNPLTAIETFRLDALTGNALFTGKLTTVDAEITGVATAMSQKKVKSPIATLDDVASSTVTIKSPKDTIAIGSDGTAVTLDAKVATAVKAGSAAFPVGGGLTIDVNGNVRLDGAISPIKYLDLWNAATNTPKLSDATAVPETFYIVHIAGTQDLGSGAITFAVGDWVLAQEDIGGKAKYVKVPMSEVLGAITASMIKAGTLGKGIAIDTDQNIKTSAGVSAKTVTTETITVTNIIVTGSLIGQK